MDSKLKDFETLLHLEGVRPCDFWDNVTKENWEKVLDLIHQSKTKKDLYNIYMKNYGG